MNLFKRIQLPYNRFLSHSVGFPAFLIQRYSSRDILSVLWIGNIAQGMDKLGLRLLPRLLDFVIQSGVISHIGPC